MGKKYRSDPLAAVHETALGLTKAGVMDKRTMKAFDEMCLTPVEELTAEQIRQIRLREKASQAVFARYLNVTTGLVSQWERGEKHPPRRLAQAAYTGRQEGTSGRFVSSSQAAVNGNRCNARKAPAPSPRKASGIPAVTPCAMGLRPRP
jgi:putative transcriptional regulator